MWADDNGGMGRLGCFSQEKAYLARVIVVETKMKLLQVEVYRFLWKNYFLRENLIQDFNSKHDFL